MEEWKEVEGWGGKYQVSNYGEVRNVWDGVPVAKVITGIPQYYYVNMTHPSGKRKLVRLHRLVAQAFISNPDNLPMVDHINRDKMYNQVSNLRWVDRSGNQRNTENSIYFDDVHFKDFVKKYENPEAAYSHIWSSLSSGLSNEEALERYQEYLERGRMRRKVDWKGVEVYLTDLCKEFKRDYKTVLDKLSEGWDLWNAVLDIRPSWVYSFEVMDSKGVGHWYRDTEMFEATHPKALKIYKRLFSEGLNLDGVLAYDGKDHLRQTVGDFTGTIKELCEYYETSLGAVETNMTRKGMTLEEALLTPRQRVKRLSINGVYNSPKYWYESFGINAKRANGWKANKEGRTFKETFEYFGVDTSEMVISTV